MRQGDDGTNLTVVVVIQLYSSQNLTWKRANFTICKFENRLIKEWFTQHYLLDYHLYKKLNKKQIKSPTILILLDLTCHCWPTTPSCLSFLKPYFHFLLLKFLCSFQYPWNIVGPQEMDLGHNFISLYIFPQTDNLLTWFTFTQTLLFWAPDPYNQPPTWHFHFLICLSKNK